MRGSSVRISVVSTTIYLLLRCTKFTIYTFCPASHLTDEIERAPSINKGPNIQTKIHTQTVQIFLVIPVLMTTSFTQETAYKKNEVSFYLCFLFFKN